jgi:restriction endonuclease S subunit
MSFSLSPKIEKNKIFIVNRSELEGRFSPSFYIPNIMNQIRLIGAKRKISRFSKVCLKITDGTHFTPQYIDDAQEGVMFLSVKDVRMNKVSFSNTKFISKKAHQKLTKRCKPEPGDILLTKVGNTYGLAAVVPNNSPEFSIFVSLALLKIDKEKFDPYFVMHFLNSKFGKVQMDRLIKGIGQPDLHLEDIANIRIPSPSFCEQKTLVQKMDAAYSTKKRKEAEAQQSLDSIDNYLLSELGIKLLDSEENTIQNRVFFCDLRSVVGRRLDPLYHSGNIYRFIESSIYDFECISKVTTYMKTGFASGKQDQSNDDQDIIQIRSTNISDEREFVFTRNVYIRKSELSNRKDDILQFGEVLFNNTNSQELVGKSIFFDLDNPYFCSNHTTRIGVYKDRVDPQYLTHILNLYQRNKVFFKVCTNWNNQSGVNVNVLGQIKIPIPPLDKQLEIVDHITEIRNRAKQLRQEAEADLEKAKKEVEVMILGENETEALLI